MSFKPTLSAQLSQRLVLTPQLRQRIEMLQMTKLELSDLVTQQMIENPVLEELAPEEVAIPADIANVDYTEVPNAQLNGTTEAPENLLNSFESFERGDSSYSQTADAGEYNMNAPGEGGEGAEFAQAANETRDFESGEVREGEIGDRDSFNEIDFGQTFEEYLDPGYKTRETETGGEDKPSFEQFLSSETNLSEYLNWQLRLTITSPEVQAAAEAIIGNLNDDGFLDSPLEEIAQLGEWPAETMEGIMTDLQNAEAALVPDAKHAIATESGHNIHQDQPELVIAAIRAVVDAVRNPATWTA